MEPIMPLPVVDPGLFPFKGDMRVRFRDTDSQGHLYFANYLVFADEVTGFFMDELGFQSIEPEPCYIFTVNLQIDYIEEIRPNGTVAVSVGHSRLGNSSADVIFVMQNKANGVILARGSFTQVFVDRQTRKSIPIPAAFKNRILEVQSDFLKY
jgi:acyl-CoA thioester hydrolase